MEILVHFSGLQTPSVDWKFLAQNVKRKIKATEAFSATFDTDSIHPEKNFLDTIDMVLSDVSFDTLVIGGGSVDISNINTINEPISPSQAKV